ncbi:MAG: hypothetical protein HYY16_10060 [Planctomycetes bacterium]|nr:hypothetical protein [Planctomycetota bacterium]
MKVFVFSVVLLAVLPLSASAKGQDPELTERIQRALDQAMRSVHERDPGERGRRVEEDLWRRLHAEKRLVSNVRIGLAGDRLIVMRAGRRQAYVPGATVVAQADLVQVDRGKDLIPERAFQRSSVRGTWEIKSSPRRMTPEQRGHYVRVFGRPPVEVHPTFYPVRRGDLGWRVLRGELKGAAPYLGVYLGVEAVRAVLADGREGAREYREQLRDVRFWAPILFSSAAAGAAHQVTSFLPAPYRLKLLLRSTAALTAGVVAADLLSGRRPSRDTLYPATSFLTVGFLVRFATRGLAGPRILVPLYEFLRIAVTLYGGEAMAGLARTLVRSHDIPRGGVSDAIRGIAGER